MALTPTKTEIVPGLITHVYIGKDSSNGVDITRGIVHFDYWKKKDVIRYEYPGAATSPDIEEQPSSFGWRLRFISDCRVAFFATDVQTAAGNQYAMVDNGFSNKIAYFRVIMPIEDGTGANKTRTYTITGGRALWNKAEIGDYEDALYEYEGDAEYISYSDA